MAGLRRRLRVFFNLASTSEDVDETPSGDPRAVEPVDVELEDFVEAVGVDPPSDGEVIEVVLSDTVLAVANVGGVYHAISGICPHAGGPLGEGALDGMVLWCPFHRWNFHLETGIASVGGKKLVDIYEVRVQAGRLFFRL